jgi:formamidopyrimidine-DNA glycosylase
MPELPEVETVMRGLSLRLLDRTIVAARVARADLRFPIPPDLGAVLTGTRVLGFRRRGKYILMRLRAGHSLLLHLGMSGRVVLDPPGTEPRPRIHEHLVLRTDQGWRIALIDPRRFGALDLVPTADEDGHRLLAAMGPEPLEPGFGGEALGAALAGRRTSLKAALLDQRVVAGLGNIYVSEALFRARLSPLREARGIGKNDARRLARAIRAVLSEAIAAGGSSLRDYVQPDGALGYFQHRWKVYGHEGDRCERCPKTPGACSLIQRMTLAGRSTFWCPRTQH